MGTSVRRKNLFHRNNLVISGNLCVSNTLCVGGNLTVIGDLDASEVFCLGRLVVQGEIRALNVYTGLGVEVTGDLRTISLTAKGGSGFEPDLDEVAQYIVAWAVHKAEGVDDPTSYLADEEVLSELIEHTPSESVVVGGDCIVSGPVDIVGNIAVCGLFNPDETEVYAGSVEAGTIFAEGDFRADNVTCKGLFEVQGCLDVPGSIDCAQLIAFSVVSGDITTNNKEGNIDCESINAVSVTAHGSIMCRGPITCSGYLSAHGCITAEGVIRAGKDHGILAGLGVSRSEWLRAGYVCSPVRPRNILTGLYRSLANRRKKYEDPRPSRIRVL